MQDAPNTIVHASVAADTKKATAFMTLGILGGLPTSFEVEFTADYRIESLRFFFGGGQVFQPGNPLNDVLDAFVAEYAEAYGNNLVAGDTDSLMALFDAGATTWEEPVGSETHSGIGAIREHFEHMHEDPPVRVAGYTITPTYDQIAIHLNVGATLRISGPLGMAVSHVLTLVPPSM